MIIVSKNVISLKFHFHISMPVRTALKGKKGTLLNNTNNNNNNII